MKRKSYEELEFTDDFMFCKILEKRTDLCKELLEIILGKKIKRVVVNKQKTIDVVYTAKSIRFDVYVEEAGNTVYDIEMQTDVQKYVAKRSRYYQGMIDLNLIEKGEKYTKLKTSYIIFICMFDPFGKGRHIYTFENRCVEDLEIRLSDETTKIFLNPYGTENDISEEMDEFLKFVAGEESSSTFAKRMQKEVENAKQNKEWRLEYMTLHMRDMENQEIGEARTLVLVVGNVSEKLGGVQAACDFLNVSIQDYEEAKELLKNYGE